MNYSAARSAAECLLLAHEADMPPISGAGVADNRVERRLAAILAADVAGYSRLMGADEEGVLARLQRYH
jgi:class 3 adenylate cyclase